MALFQDAMDPSRVVKPISYHGDKAVCAVYFTEHGRLNYAGQTTLAARLLGEEPMHKRIGFYPRPN